VSQRWALSQQAFKPLCTSITDLIDEEIEVNQ
jgi:hypothetical protein